MMSDENVEVVRRSLAAWNGQDLTAWSGWFHPDGELDWSRARGPFKGVYRGPREREDFWEVFWATFEDVHIETHGFTEAGSDVVVPNTAHIRGREGIEVVSRTAFVFTIEHGQITRLQMFQERDEAFESVGLREEGSA
jgi:ketosteroid isomerase-like protein